jgi:hypothetical protein
LIGILIRHFYTPAGPGGPWPGRMGLLASKKKNPLFIMKSGLVKEDR